MSDTSYNNMLSECMKNVQTTYYLINNARSPRPQMMPNYLLAVRSEVSYLPGVQY